MKLSEMNVNQRKVWEAMDAATREYIGGNENGVSDYEIGSPEYNSCKRFLDQTHDELKEFFYLEVITDVQKEARFCGKEFVMERIEIRLNKWGY